MKHALLIAEFLSTPWAVMPARLSAMAAVIARWSLDRAASPEAMAAVQTSAQARAARKATVSALNVVAYEDWDDDNVGTPSARAERKATARAGNGAIAVLPMYGIVTQRGNMADAISGSGSMSTQQFAGLLREAVADETIGGIVIDIDSPGGSVYGVQELADQLLEARAAKPVYAVANSLAASAAYWLGASATELYVTPSGEVGSIGVYLAHEDWSKALDEMGVKTTFIQAGEFKTEGAPQFPLSDEARAHLQASVDAYYADFTKAIAKGRGVPVGQVRDGMGKGRVLRGADAVAAGMVNGVATLDQVLGKMAKDLRAGQQKPGSRVDLERRRLALGAA